MELTELQTPLNGQRQAKCAPTNCPVRSALSMLAEDKWRLVVLFELAASGELKFGELLRAVGGVRTKALTKSLRALEANNLVDREVIVGTPTRVSYRLTDSALKVIPILLQLKDWVQTLPAEPSRTEASARAGSDTFVAVSA
jgi:DNA-binding HxlR family transcriptional regulator